MAGAVWSRCGAADCVRVASVAPAADVRVRAGATDVVGELPSMAGKVVRDGDDACFVPRFPFVEGTTYTVLVEGREIAALVRPRTEAEATTAVVAIHPTAREVPRNLLRFYIHFSSRMSEGYASDHIRLVDDDGHPMIGALLPTEHELWDGERRRLTVLLDPARIKRGLAGHRALGYPLRDGASFRLIVDSTFRDARGIALRGDAERRYTVRGDERSRVEPREWMISEPRCGGRAPLEVEFPRPLDYALVDRCLRVIGPDGGTVDGTTAVGFEERSWAFVPRIDWPPGRHSLVVDPALEDVAGNSVNRVFDRDITLVRDDPTNPRPIRLHFAPR